MQHESQNAETLFHRALEFARGERAAFLSGACGNDAALRQRVEALLAAHDQAKDFLPPGPEGEQTSTVIAETAPTEEVGLLIGRYKLLEKLGEGGFGAVWLAEQREPVRRKIALKIIKLGMDTKQVVARFEAERQALALMDHPNIAKVLDAGTTENGRPYFVMELVRGIPITRFCDENKMATQERLDLFIKVCHAIQHAHQKGIIHRDIKPSNVLVTLHDGVPVPKVIDFGIAKATQGELTDKTIHTQFQQFIGTPAYMSPEQAEMSGWDIDTRSDIYSLGVLLYELLIGKTPFDGNELLMSGLDEMRRTIREKEPLRPSTRLDSLEGEERTTTAKRRGADPGKLASILRGDLDWIVMKALEKDRTRRYETANGLAADLKRYLTNEPVIARPPSATYRLQKAFRRNKLVFAASGAIAVSLLIGTSVSTWQWIRARQSEHRAQSQAERADAEAAGARKAEKIALEESELAKSQEQRANAAAVDARQNLYAADMHLAYRAREEENLDLALQLLNKHRPQAGETDLRGWEWRYLWSLCQSDELGTFATNSAPLSQIVMSPDGSLLSAAEWGPARTAVKVWGFPSGRLLAIAETNDAAGSVAFSPNGKLLAFTTRSHGLKLWDITTRQEIATFPGRYGQLLSWGLLFSPDGRTLAASGAELEILLWNVETRTSAGALKGGSGGYNSLAFSPDGGTLVTGSYDSSIRLWSVESGREIARLTNHTAPVSSLALSADGKTLASAGWEDKTIRIWDLGARRQIAVLTNHTRQVFSVAFSPDQKTLASGSGDFSIKLWDTTRWQEVSTLRGSLDEIYAVTFSRDGKTLVSGAKDGTIKTWNPKPKFLEPDRLKRPSVADGWEMRGPMVYATRTNGTISCWSATTLRQISQYVRPEENRTNSLASDLTPTGKLACANRQSEIVVWDLPTRRLVARLPWVPGVGKTVRFAPDEKLLIAAAAGQCLTVWDSELRPIATLPKSTAEMFVVGFSPDLRLIAAGDFDGTVEVWDLSRKQRVAEWQAHQQTIQGIDFMPNGKWLVTSSWDATVKLWDIETQRQEKAFTRTLNAFDSLALAPDGQRIAAGTYNGFVKIWNSTTGQDVATLKTGDQAVGGLQFLPPDGDTLISLTDDEVRLWRAPSWAEIATAEAKEKKEARLP